MKDAEAKDNEHERRGQIAGLGSAFSAYMLWGILPLYWRVLEGFSAGQILLSRIIGSFVFLLVLVAATRQLRPSLAYLKNRSLLGTVTCAGLLLSFNWLIYIWAVNNGHIYDASLGYFLNPLVNTLFGMMFFGDRLNRLQWLAIGLAACGVACQVVMVGRFPWVALSLAFSFGAYGVLRKREPFGSIPGLFLETSVLTPLAIGAGLFFWISGSGGLFEIDMKLDVFLLFSGIATTVPLLFFAHGARKLRLTTMGVMQYLSPTCTMLIGLFVFKESLSRGYLVSFAFIWAGLIVYSLASVHGLRSRNMATIP